MDNSMIPFNFDGYDIRVVMTDGKPWFVATDVATALGYARPNDAVSQHVDSEDRSTTVNHRSGPDLVIINESGMYALIFGSKLPRAKGFKRWVTSEVLPAIQQQGAYMRKAEVEKIVEGISKPLRDLVPDVRSGRMPHDQYFILVGSMWEMLKVVGFNTYYISSGEIDDLQGIGREGDTRQIRRDEGLRRSNAYMERYGQRPLFLPSYITGQLRTVCWYDRADYEFLANGESYGESE
jgi:anti-repressor protein